jgi:hypothetical protein
MPVNNSYELLKSMRGETSKPLIAELSRIIQHGVDAGSSLIAEIDQKTGSLT